MKVAGILLVVVGVIWGAFAFNMETAVETESFSYGSMYIPRKSVHNLEKADRRRNHLIGSGITILSGILLLGFGTLSQRKNETEHSSIKCPYCAEHIKSEAVVCRYCGKEISDEARNSIVSLQSSNVSEGSNMLMWVVFSVPIIFIVMALYYSSRN